MLKQALRWMEGATVEDRLRLGCLTSEPPRIYNFDLQTRSASRASDTPWVLQLTLSLNPKHILQPQSPPTLELLSTALENLWRKFSGASFSEMDPVNPHGPLTILALRRAQS